MKYLNILIVTFLISMLLSCEGMYDKQKQYEGEIIYPAKYDTIKGKIGFERVEIDLLKSGRLLNNKIKLGKAKKTKVVYGDKTIIIDSLVSYLNISNLTQPKLYRFKIYTIDEFDNESIPQEIALIPFTQSDLASFAMSPPRIMASPTSAIIDWPNGLSSVLLNYYSLTFEYKDKNGVIRTGKRGSESRFFITNLEPGKPVEIQMKYKIIPKVNREPILDTVTFADKLTIQMPTATSEFSVSEKEILNVNGVTTFTANSVASVTKLIYPIHANSLQDIFYFPNLKILDLTGGTLFNLPKLDYDRNGIKDFVGGGQFAPFMRKAGDVSIGNSQSLKDFLEAGILEKVYYQPNTMGLDNLLAPYVKSGIVTLVTSPSEILVDNQFHLDGVVQDGAWRLDYVYPATDAPSGVNLENIYKVECKARSASFVFALPKEYQFNLSEYKYLKFKFYTPAKNAFTGDYAPFNQLWLRFMNNMWAFGGNSRFGQEYWDLPRQTIPDSNFQSWTDVTIDLSNGQNKHNRVIVINIGGEPNIGTWNPPVPIIYYFANIRLSK